MAPIRLHNGNSKKSIKSLQLSNIYPVSNDEATCLAIVKKGETTSITTTTRINFSEFLKRADKMSKSKAKQRKEKKKFINATKVAQQFILHAN